MRVFLVLLYLYASYVIAQPKNETFDFKLAKELEHKRGGLLKEVYMKEGCRVYDIDFDKEEGGYIEESLPSPSFITRRKDYYPNGKIKSIKHFIGENVLIGKSVYYNKKGVKRIVDEDKKFKKIKYPYILQFLEKKGHINLKTGKGRIVDIKGTNYFGFQLYYVEKMNAWKVVIKGGYPEDKCLEKYIELAKKEKQKKEEDSHLDCSYPERNCDLHYFIDAISGKQISKQEYAKRYRAAFGENYKNLDYIFTEP